MLNKFLQIVGIILVAVILFVGGAWLGMAASSRMRGNVAVRPNIQMIPRFGPRTSLIPPGCQSSVKPGMPGVQTFPDKPGNPGYQGGCDNQVRPSQKDDQGYGDNRNDQKNSQGDDNGQLPGKPGQVAPVTPATATQGSNPVPQFGPSGLMPGGFIPDPSLVPAAGQTLSLDNAIKVAQAYVAAYDNSNLKVVEVMQFDNHFYARVVETDIQRGAFEILIDPRTAAVFPEPGPNMMWNLKYGMMSSQGGMMGGVNTTDGGKTMTVDLAEATAFAQKELDRLVPGAKVEADGTAFYGYYTFDYTVNSKIVGMLGVNGFTGDVVLHAWHGNFVAEQQVK